MHIRLCRWAVGVPATALYLVIGAEAPALPVVFSPRWRASRVPVESTGSGRRLDAFRLIERFGRPALALPLLVAVLPLQPELRSAIHRTLAEVGAALYAGWIEQFLLDPWFYLVFGLALLLQWIRPAVSHHRVLSRSHLHDLLWTMLMAAFYVCAMPVYISALHALYDR